MLRSQLISASTKVYSGFKTFQKHVNHYKYLRLVLDTELSDDNDIQKQLQCQHYAANKLRGSVFRCSNAAEHILFISFCTRMCISQLWCDFMKSCMLRLCVA